MTYTARSDNRVNGYRVPPCSTETLGDWGGQEERAADRFVRLSEIVAETLPTCDPHDINVLGDAQERYEKILRSLADWWLTDDALLTATDDEFRTAARKLV